MKITKIGFKNYRVFKDYTEFKLKPLTILTGPNSSGKSSFWKALLFLKENANSYNEDCNDFYFNKEHNLGNFNLIANNSEEEIYFSLTYIDDYKIEINLFDYDKDPTFESPQYFNYFKITNGLGELISFRYSYSFIIYVDQFSDYIETIINYYNNYESTVSNLVELLKNVKECNFFEIPGYLEKGYVDIELGEEETYIDIVLFLNEMFDVNLREFDVILLFPSLSNNTFLDFDQLFYLSSVNNEQIKRFYSLDDKTVFNDVASFPFNEINISLYLKNKKYKGKIEILNNFTKKWFAIFNLGKLEYKRIVLYKDLITNKDVNGFKITLNDKCLLEYGNGISQLVFLFLGLFPELVFEENTKIAKISFPRTIIVEEPENGLHPNFQSKLAEMFVEANILFNVHFIIETHSEYFIRKLQYLAAEKKLKPKDVLIHYFNNPQNIPKGELQIKHITIDEFGSLSDNFGTGFIDEATNLKFDLLRLNRQQKN